MCRMKIYVFPSATQQGKSRADAGIPIWLVPESLFLVVSLMSLLKTPVQPVSELRGCMECGARNISHLSYISERFQWIRCFHCSVFALLLSDRGHCSAVVKGGVEKVTLHLSCQPWAVIEVTGATAYS